MKCLGLQQKRAPRQTDGWLPRRCLSSFARCISRRRISVALVSLMNVLSLSQSGIHLEAALVDEPGLSFPVTASAMSRDVEYRQRGKSQLPHALTRRTLIELHLRLLSNFFINNFKTFSNSIFQQLRSTTSPALLRLLLALSFFAANRFWSLSSGPLRCYSSAATSLSPPAAWQTTQITSWCRVHPTTRNMTDFRRA